MTINTRIGWGTKRTQVDKTSNQKGGETRWETANKAYRKRAQNILQNKGTNRVTKDQNIMQVTLRQYKTNTE